MSVKINGECTVPEDRQAAKVLNVYDNRYKGNYRENLNGYEIARWRALKHFITKIVDLSNVNAVLDYGAGSGLHVELWKRVFPKADLFFCEISSVALRKLGDKYPEFNTNCRQVRDNRALFNNGSFDVVMSIEVMEHVLNLEAYLEDIFRLLRPGGYFVWTTPCGNKFSIEHMYSMITNQIQKTNEGYRRWNWEDQTHLRRLKSSEIEKRLEEVGFSKINFRFRAHFFSFVCTNLCKGRLRKLGEKMMVLDYALFRLFPQGASMLGVCCKKQNENYGINDIEI